MDLNESYWSKRYQDDDTGWDIGYCSTPLREYFDQLTDKSISILIPGAGNAWEAEYLFNNGFKDITVIDLADQPLKNISERIPGFPLKNLIKGDFFEHRGHYDLIIEQTFFCAIDPTLRAKYAKKMHELLKPEGKLVGLLFDDLLNASQPPFGGSKSEYEGYFRDLFHLRTFEPCYNSIKPRQGRELFIRLQPR